MKFLRGILDLLFPPRDAETLVNENNANTIGAYVRVRKHEDGTISLLPYRVPLVKACITEAKFRDNERAQKLLASVLSDYLASMCDDIYEEQTLMLVPIPLSEARRRERGYNQTERIATFAEISLDTKVLSRTRDTLPQTSLGGARRRENVRKAFRAFNPNPAYTYIVFDDVRTTGATLLEAVETLRNAGATKVIGLSLAH